MMWKIPGYLALTTWMIGVSHAQAESSAVSATPTAPFDGSVPAVVPTTPDAALAGIDAGSLPRDLSPWGMYQQADWVVKSVMIGLAFASVLTWTVWVVKTLEVTKAIRRTKQVLADMSKSRSLAEAVKDAGSDPAPAAMQVRAAMAEATASADGRGEALLDRVSLQLERIQAAAGRQINFGTGILATIGATAPFVGLFGTVWGIMNAFIGISKAQTTNLAVVAPGIAEALLTTAIGLLAAIPAVVIYNLFARSIANYRAHLADVGAEVLKLLSRDIDRWGAQALPGQKKNG